MDIKSQALLENLIMQGAIEMSGIDQSGEMTYSITDKLQEVHPELYLELKDEFEHNMFQGDFLIYLIVNLYLLQ